MINSGVLLASFLAAAVEVVETATVLLALGLSRGWRSVRVGAVVALVILAFVVGAASPVIKAVPIDVLRSFVGVFALVFGLSWLRKSALRASGRKRLRDEDAVFQKMLAEPNPSRATSQVDKATAVLAAKAMLLEGVEVVLVVLALGGGSGSMGSAILGAVLAVGVVALVAARLQRPLARVPENTIKTVVGLLLVTFGLFWLGEGTGASWPGADFALVWIFVVAGVLFQFCVRMLRVTRHEKEATPK